MIDSFSNKGLIDEVMIYDRTLNEDEITRLATQGLAIEPDDSLATTWGMMKK